MADSVNATASLTPGSPVVLLAASKPPPASDGARPARNVSTVSDPTQASSLARSRKVEEQVQQATREDVEQAAEKVRDYVKQSTNSDLQFQVDKDTGISFFKVVDPRTKEVIRQFPPEEVIAMARKLRELASKLDVSGVLLDKEG